MDLKLVRSKMVRSKMVRSKANAPYVNHRWGVGDSFARKKIETNQILSMDLLRFREKPIKFRAYMKEPTARHKER